MEKLIITGFSGFVARHFLQFLYDNEIKIEVLGVDIKSPEYEYKQYEKRFPIQFKKTDLLNMEDLKNIFLEFMPNYILHLASYSSVAYSWNYPVESFVNNTNIFLNLIAVVKEFNKKCRILSIGSSEEYGDVTNSDIPLDELQPVNPISPYAVARVSQEMLSQVFVNSYDMNIVMTRSFNHIGFWQDERFVIPSFIKRILTIKEQQLTEGVIETGDTSIIRDFVDVRDVVRAYYMLLLNGGRGRIYNICSGRGVSLNEIIGIIGKQLDITVRSRINPEYVRPNENRIIIGTNLKIREELGWVPQVSLEQSIGDMIAYMQKA